MPLVAAAARARKAIAADGKAGAEEYVGGYRSAPRHTKAGFDEITKQADKAAKDQTKAAEKAAKDQARAYEYVYRIKQRYLEKEERDADRSLRKQEESRKRQISGAGRALGGVAWSGAQRVVGAGASLIGDAARESMETQGIATRVSINARASGKGFIDPTSLRKQFEDTAVANPGQKAQDIGKATQAYVDLTGDIDTARSSMSTFATVASATGAQVEDVATAAASLGAKFDVKSVDDMQKVMAGLAFQGKGGAMTMADLAAQFQRLASAGAAFGLGKGPQAVAKLGGLLQIARQGTRSPAQAATAVENILASLTQKAKQHGVSLYDKKGGQRDVNEVIADVVSKEGGSDIGTKKAALIKFFAKQGIRGANPLIDAYAGGAAGKTGAAAQEGGRDAVLKTLNDMAEAGGSWAELTKDAAMQQSTASNQLAGAWEQLKAAAGDKLAPTLANVATALVNGGLDPFITTVQALGEAAVLAVDGLKAIGLLKPHEISKTEKLATAQKELDEYDKKRAFGPETAEQAAKHEALQNAVATATDDLWQPISGSKGKKSTTQDEFAKRYAELSGAEGDDLEGQRVKGIGLAGAITRDPRDTFATNDMLQGFSGENKAQRDYREDYQGQVTRDHELAAMSAKLDKLSGTLTVRVENMPADGLRPPAPGASTGPAPIRK